MAAFNRQSPCGACPGGRLQIRFGLRFKAVVLQMNLSACGIGNRTWLLCAQVLEEADVFIFTLGLTETWCTVADGAALPVCPGSVLGGQFDPEQHTFINYDVAQVDAHLDAFIHELQAVNPRAQVLLTVSPVPLLATYEPRHVLQATVYSKSVLRVVAEQAVRRHAHVGTCQ
jgi:hypothetical protein